MNERRMSLGNRVISLVLALVMVIGMLPSGIFAFHAKAADATVATTTASVEEVRQYAARLLADSYADAGTNNDLSWTTETGKGDNWRYYTGVMMDAMLMLGVNSDSDVTNSKGNALEFAQVYMDFNIKDDGTIAEWHEGELDSVPPALTLLTILDSVGVDEAHREDYEKAIHFVYNEIMGQTDYSNCGGNFKHKESGWDTWNIGLDGIYMAQPFLVKYANALKSGKITNANASADTIYEEVYDRLMWVADNMYDEDSGLYHHGWNVSGSKGNGVFWSRGIGWYATGLVMCIDMMPEGTYKTNLITKLPKLFDGMIKYQDKDTGLWYNIVNTTEKVVTSGDNKDNYNRLETSGSGLMAYAMMKAYAEGWVGSTYGEAGLKAFNGITENKLSNGVLSDIYKQSGVESEQSGYCKYAYVDDEAKGSGGVLMAASVAEEAAAKLAGNTYAGEVYTIGVVSAPEMTIAAGASVDSTDIKATLVGNQGTVTNVAGNVLSYSVGDASNGKATVTASYNGVAIDAFEVNVVDPAVPAEGEGTLPIESESGETPTAPSVTAGSWVEINAGGSGTGTSYYRVTTLTPGKLYVFTPDSNSSSAGSSYVSGGKLTKFTVDNNDVTQSGSEYIYTMSVADDHHWQVDSDGRIFTVNSNGTYYLQITDNSSGKLALVTSAADACKFTFASSGTNKGNNGYFTMQTTSTSNETAYLKLESGGFNSSGSSGKIRAFEKIPAGDPKYGMLSGSATYAYPVGTSTDILAQIQSDYKIYTNTTNSGTGTEAGWSAATYSWDKTLDTAKAGTYTLSVKVDNVEIGKIPVLIYNNTVTTNYDVDLSVTPGAIVATVGDANRQLNATVLVSELSGYGSVVKYSGGNSSVATVTEDGLVSIKGEGSTTIIATVTNITHDGATYDADDFGTITATIPVLVTDGSEHIHSYTSAVTKAATCTVAGVRTYTCSGCEEGTEGHSYTEAIEPTGHSWNSGEVTKAATCNEAGTKTFTCTVCSTTKTETIAATGAHTYANGVCSVCGTTDPDYVEPDIVSVTAPNGASDKATVATGRTLQLTANVTGGASVTWSSSSDAIATVSNTGLVTGVTPGTVTITATVTSATRAVGDSATFEVTVTEAASGDEVAAPVTGQITTTISGSNSGETVTQWKLFEGTSLDTSKTYNVVIVSGTSALMNKGSSAQTTGGVAAVTIEDEVLTFNTTSEEAASVWQLKAVDGKWQITNTLNGTTYGIKDSASPVALTTQTINSIVNVSNTTTWRIRLASSRDLVLDNNAWTRAETAFPISFYTQQQVADTGSTSPSITVYNADLTASDISMTVAQTGVSAAKPGITVKKAADNSAATPTSYAVTYAVTGGDNCITITSDGAITANSAGTAHVTATLSAIDMGEGTDVINTPATVTFKVVVTASGSDTPSTGSTYIHNFTNDNKTSSFYTIAGDLSTSKGSASYDGQTLTQCLKMNGEAEITFKASATGTITLVFNTGSAGKKIDVNGTIYTIPSDGILTIGVSDGDNVIKRNDGESFLYYMAFAENSGVVAYSLSDLVFNPESIKAGESTTVSTTVTASDGSSHTYTIVYTVDDTNKATVNGTTITGKAAGDVTVTATLTHVDGTELATPVTKTGTITVSAATVTGGTLNNTSVTVTQGNNINLAALAATVTYSNGTTSNVNLAQSGFTFEENGQSININDVDATVGSHSIEVFYNGVSVGTMTVVVNAKAEITDTITYELDTDGIDAGAEYIVVDYLNDKAYALGHNSGSTTEKAYEVTIEGDKVIISESDVATALWTFEAVEGESGYYYIGNGGYYVKPGGSSVFNTAKTATQVIAYDLAKGQYRINVGEASKIRDLNVTSTSDWARADQGDVSPVYLYKKVEAQTTLTLGDLPVLYIGGTPYQATLNDYVTSVKYNGAAYTDYVIEWSSNDNTVATVSDGVVSAVGGGRTQLVAKLVSVGGTDVSAQNITAETNVTVVVPSVNIGEDLNKFVDDTFTIIPEVLIGSTAPESYKLIWTSSNLSVATVDENGRVTVVGDGSSVITAQIKSINGNDISTYMTITDSITVNAEVIAITSGELSSDTVTVEVGATADELKAALSEIVLTLTKNNGDKIEVNNATLFEDVDLTAVNTAAGGTYYLDVSYSDPNSDYVFSGTVTVKVFDKSMIEAEGFLTQETNVEYILDTDGIDVNEEYVIVMQNSDGEWVALMNPDASGSGSTKGSSQVVTRIENGNKITVSQNADLVRWLFTNQGSSSSNDFTYKTFTVKNNNRYLKGGGDSILGSSSKNVGVWYANDGSGQYYVGTDYSSGKVRALTLSGDSWTRASSAKYPDDTDARVYMYKRSSVGTDYPVGFKVQPESKTIAEGTYYTVPTSGIQVVVGDTECNDYVIEWSSSDTKVATVDSNGKITAVGAGTATITATLMTADGYKVYSNADNTQGISDEIAITVQADQLTYTLQGSPLTVALGGEPDFSKISLLIDSTLSDDMVIPSDQLVFKYIDAVSKGFDTDVANSSCEVDVYYNGSKVGVVVLNVADNAYDGLDEATSYPEYPNTGAVRMDKTATGINFNTTGVAKIELNAAGVSSRNPVDVVLIVDVSNSMNWSMDWFVGMTDDEVKKANDAAKTDATKDDKLDMAMLAAQDFAAILMENNVSGSSMNNSITFVTFGGNDKDRGGTSDVDTVVTAFVGEETLANVNNSFQNTKFTGSQTLAIAGTDGNAIVSGGARGNTMYDSAFLEAIDAVNALKIAKAGSVEAYEKSGREVHVIFMTDGAPSHYNGLAHANGNTCDGLYTRTDCSDAEWLAHIQEPNTQATKLYAMVDDFHIVGYDLAHGGYGTHTWAEAELGRVLGGLVENKALDYTLATDTDKLNTFFNELGHSLAYAGTHALVTDIVSEEFVLQTDPIDVDGDGNITLTGDNVVDIAPSIQILERRLVVRTDIGSTLKINGVDTLINEEHLGMYVDGGEDVLATVTFDTSDPADKKAFSSALDYGVDIWNDETNIITGAYFTYSFSSKTFEWNIGNIEDTEIALTYYGYLTGAKNEAGEGGRAEGIYATNEMATLKYINTDNQVVTREYPVPHVAWGSAVVNVRFFLVNKNGEFVNRANVTFDNPANRIFLVNSATYKFDLNANPESMVPGHINAEAAFIAAGINSQYVLYDDVNMDVTNSTMDNKFGSASIVSGIDKSNTGSLVEFVDVYGDRSYIQTTINIPVILADLGESSQKMSDSSVVIDFSNSVQWDSLGANERLYDGYTVDKQESTIELVGFTTYNPAADLKDYIDYELASPNWKQTYSTAYGTFTLVADNAEAGIDDYIQYTPNAPLNGTDHVFAVFRFSSHPVDKPDGYMDYYYMYKQVSVIPATVVHYETTGNMAAAFQSNFNGAAWSVQSIAESVAGATQSNKNENYGADTSYNSCINFAGGSSLFVENTDPFGSRPTVKFTFTGTGIDIISKTDPNQGRVKMTLTGKNTGTTKSVMVLNKGVDNLYQIPVLSVEGLPYDTYEVEIVVYSKTSAYGGQFYLDAINVYGSAQETEVVGSTAAGNTTVGSLYEAAGESKPQILEIRDILLGNNNFGDITASGVQGAVYIDGNTTLGDTSTNFNNYDKIGPNNEVYLSNNQAVAFKLRVEDLAKLPTTLDIGLKSVNGSAAKAVIYVYKTGASDTTPAEYTVTSATAMFYDILGGEDIKTFLGENNEFYVVIANKGTGTLSVTDLKVGYGAAKGSVETVVDITVGSLTQETLKASAQVVSAAIANMNAETNTAIAYAMYTTTIVVVTGQDAQSIVVEDLEGNEIAVNASYVDSDNGARRWRVLVRFNEVGTDTYNIYGIGTNGSRHDTYQQITVDVQLFAPANTN